MRIRRRNWILKRIILGFAVAALVAPAAAQARIDEGIQGQPNSSSEIGVVTGAGGYPYAGATALPPGELGVVTSEVNPLARMTVRDSDAIANVRGVSSPQVVSSPGFDWSDAGIGAGLGLALGLVLVGGAALVASRHTSRPQTA